jgi:hypothetical protein
MMRKLEWNDVHDVISLVSCIPLWLFVVHPILIGAVTGRHVDW